MSENENECVCVLGLCLCTSSYARAYFIDVLRREYIVLCPSLVDTTKMVVKQIDEALQSSGLFLINVSNVITSQEVSFNNLRT